MTYFNDMQNERLIIVVADAGMPIAHSSRARDYSVFGKLEPYISLAPTPIQQGFKPAAASCPAANENLAVQTPWEIIGEFLGYPQMPETDTVFETFCGTGTDDIAPEYFAIERTQGLNQHNGIFPEQTPDPNQFSLNLPLR